MKSTQRESLFPPVPDTVPRLHKAVRDTSIAAYAEARERLKGRSADVLRWLAHHWNAKQISPTSAELEFFASANGQFNGKNMDNTQQLLHVRRGISDLQVKGLVETVEKRVCRVSRRECHTWRVKQR